MFKNSLSFLLGVFICAFIALLGLLLTQIIESGFGFFLSLVLIPVCGNYFYKNGKKPIAYGLITGLIPIGILSFIIFIASQLH